MGSLSLVSRLRTREGWRVAGSYCGTRKARPHARETGRAMLRNLKVADACAMLKNVDIGALAHPAARAGFLRHGGKVWAVCARHAGHGHRLPIDKHLLARLRCSGSTLPDRLPGGVPGHGLGGDRGSLPHQLAMRPAVDRRVRWGAAARGSTGRGEGAGASLPARQQSQELRSSLAEGLSGGHPLHLAPLDGTASPTLLPTGVPVQAVTEVRACQPAPRAPTAPDRPRVIALRRRQPASWRCHTGGAVSLSPPDPSVRASVRPFAALGQPSRPLVPAMKGPTMTITSPCGKYTLADGKWRDSQGWEPGGYMSFDVNLADSASGASAPTTPPASTAAPDAVAKQARQVAEATCHAALVLSNARLNSWRKER